MTYSADEARVVPAVAQGLQEAIAGINLKVAAVAFGAKHLFIVCRGNMTRTLKCKKNTFVTWKDQAEASL